MKAFVLGVFMPLLLVAVSSCKTEKRTSVDNPITFDTINVVKNYHLNNDSTLPSCNLRISFIYPSSYSDKDILANLKSVFLVGMFDEPYANTNVEQAVDKYVTDYIANYNEDAKSYLDEDIFSNTEFKDKYFSYYETLTDEVLYNKDNLISLQIVRSNKKGNNDTFKQYINYVINLKTGEVLNESDLFVDGYENVMGDIFRKKLIQLNNVGSIADLNPLGYYGIEEIVPNKNFLIDENGITYIFNKGEYSVPRSSEIRIFIPYNEIGHMLKPNSPISIYYPEN